MQGLFYLLGNLALCTAILWAMLNDHVPLTGRAFGILAMPDPAGEKQPSHKRRRPPPL